MQYVSINPLCFLSSPSSINVCLFDITFQNLSSTVLSFFYSIFPSQFYLLFFPIFLFIYISLYLSFYSSSYVLLILILLRPSTTCPLLLLVVTINISEEDKNKTKHNKTIKKQKIKKKTNQTKPKVVTTKEEKRIEQKRIEQTTEVHFSISFLLYLFLHYPYTYLICFLSDSLFFSDFILYYSSLLFKNL